MHPNPPSVVGGYAVQVRPRGRWRCRRSTRASRPRASRSIRNRRRRTRSVTDCAIQRHGATRHVVCIDEAPVTPKSFQYTVTTFRWVRRTTSPDAGMDVPGWPATQKAIAVVAVAPSAGSPDRDVYVVSDRGVLVPCTARRRLPISNPLPTCVACVDDAIVVPPCGQIKGKILMHGNGQAIRENRCARRQRAELPRAAASGSRRRGRVARQRGLRRSGVVERHRTGTVRDGPSHRRRRRRRRRDLPRRLLERHMWRRDE